MKHPVPKQKTSSPRGKTRYGAFKNVVLKRLKNQTNLIVCDSCGAKKLTHRVCPECGKYRGRVVINKQKKVDKITKIKA